MTMRSRPLARRLSTSRTASASGPDGSDCGPAVRRRGGSGAGGAKGARAPWATSGPTRLGEEAANSNATTSPAIRCGLGRSAWRILDNAVIVAWRSCHSFATDTTQHPAKPGRKRSCRHGPRTQGPPPPLDLLSDEPSRCRATRLPGWRRVRGRLRRRGRTLAHRQSDGVSPAGGPTADGVPSDRQGAGGRHALARCRRRRLVRRQGQGGDVERTGRRIHDSLWPERGVSRFRRIDRLRVGRARPHDGRAAVRQHARIPTGVEAENRGPAGAGDPDDGRLRARVTRDHS